MEIVYSYWDGSGHRKAMQIKKGLSVGRFLELVKQQLLPEFNEARGWSADTLMYIKEDLIIPHVSTAVFAFVTRLIIALASTSHFTI